LAAKYERITGDLRRKIRSGDLAPGEQLPSQSALAESYDVSLPTVQQALGILQAEGLLDVIQGLGTYVRLPKHRVRRTTDRYRWEKARAHLPDEERGREGAAEHDTGLIFEDFEFFASYDTGPVTDDLAQVFGVEPGTRMLHRVYRTRLRGDAGWLNVIDSYLVYEVAAANPALLDAANEPWPGGTHHQLLTIGLEIDKITDEITARPPQGDEPELLGIGPGVSVLVLRKISIDIRGQVVEVSDVVMPADRTVVVYETQLERWQT